MSEIGANDLRRDNLAILRTKKEIEVKGGGRHSWDILAEVIRTTTSLEKLMLTYGDIMTTDLQYNKVVDAIAKNLSIKTLGLWVADKYKYGGTEEAKAVAAILKENSTIQTIYLSKNKISKGGAKVIADALKHNKTLKRIDLHHNEIGSVGAKAIAKELKENASLESINLGYNHIGDDGAKAIARALKKNASLQTLDLAVSEIGDEGATAIAEALKGNKSLQTLRLSGNPIGVEGAKAIAEALKENESLQTLMFSSNKKVGVEGTKAIAAALKENAYLTTVDLRVTDIGDEGGKAIAEALEENIELKMIDLGLNKIGAEGAKAIADALKVNESLQTLRLRGNHIGDEGAKAVADMLMENKSIQELDIGFNNIGEEGGIFILRALQQIESSAIDVVDLGVNNISEETIKKIDQKIASIYRIFSRRKIKEQQIMIAQQDKEITSMKDFMKKMIGEMGNLVNGRHGGNTSNASNDSIPDRETELQSEIERYKQENNSLKERLKNSRPTEMVDLTTNEIDPASSSGGDDSNEEEPPSKRRCTKSSLAFALEQTQQMVQVKKEAKERAAVAEANAAAARRERSEVEASLRDVQEDLEDSNELVTQQTLTTDIWQGRFDEVFELARAAGVDGNRLSEIRYRPTASRR